MTTTSMDMIADTFGFGHALLFLSEEIRKMEKHPDCTDYQRGLLRAAREAIWRIEIELLVPADAPPAADATREAAQ